MTPFHNFRWTYNAREYLIPIRVESIVAVFPTNSNRTALWLISHSEPVLVVDSLDEVKKILSLHYPNANSADKQKEVATVEKTVVTPVKLSLPIPATKPVAKKPTPIVTKVTPPRGGTTSSAI